MIVSVLSSIRQVEEIEGCMRALQEIVRQPETLPDDMPQVHAANCLKAIFSSSNLSDRVERYVQESLKISFEYLSHDV